MATSSPLPEAQRFGRSQTPESPRPVHVPEPANIPVLLNQMDPVFNDTATYNISNDQNLSPLPESLVESGSQDARVHEHDAVQNFLRETENQAADERPLQFVKDDPLVADPSSSTVDTFLTVSASEPLLQQSAANLGHPALPYLSQPPEPQLYNGDQTAEEVQAVETERNDVREREQTTTKTLDAISPQPGLKENNTEVDYQSLLDTITQSASAAPATEGLTVPASSVSIDLAIASTLPSIPGLPPKPPPQARPVEFPSYSYAETAQSSNTANTPVTIQEYGTQGTVQADHDIVSSIAGQNLQFGTQSLNNQVAALNNQTLSASLRLSPPKLAPGQTPPGEGTSPVDLRRSLDPSERPWTPRTQASYDQFLESERRYVTEGIWDKFPMGSRLFVGNLPSEKVTKRDLFHKFHKHGQLAQISIKQAYGFVQFLEATACSNALHAEQGVEIRGRKVHLEVSKPQKNTRNAGNKTGASSSRRRSRSPDRNRRNYSDYRDEPGRRSNDIRNRRSPSPRGYRSRDDLRATNQNGRSRSPNYQDNYTSSHATAYDDEASLSIPRRDPHSVPDVQLLVLEPEVAQNFINWVEQGFRAKGLQAATIRLNGRLPLGAVVKRQIIEGVQAVVKLTRIAQGSSKISLQVFDRTAGASNVNFNEYADLDLHVAADVVVQARAKERGTSHQLRYPPTPTFPSPNQYLAHPGPLPFPPPLPPQLPQHQPSPVGAAPYAFPPPPLPQNSFYPPVQSPMSPNAQPPNLQQLLANLRGPAAQPSSANPAVVSESSSIAHAYSNHHPQYQQNSNSHPSYTAYGAPPGQAFASAPQQPPQPNMQNIMDQLARYQR